MHWGCVLRAAQQGFPCVLLSLAFGLAAAFLFWCSKCSRSPFSPASCLQLFCSCRAVCSWVRQRACGLGKQGRDCSRFGWGRAAEVELEGAHFVATGRPGPAVVAAATLPVAFCGCCQPFPAHACWLLCNIVPPDLCQGLRSGRNEVAGLRCGYDLPGPWGTEAKACDGSFLPWPCWLRLCCGGCHVRCQHGVRSMPSHPAPVVLAVAGSAQQYVLSSRWRTGSLACRSNSEHMACPCRLLPWHTKQHSCWAATAGLLGGKEEAAGLARQANRLHAPHVLGPAMHVGAYPVLHRAVYWACEPYIQDGMQA